MGKQRRMWAHAAVGASAVAVATLALPASGLTPTSPPAAAHRTPVTAAASPDAKAAATKAFGKLPLRFDANLGQADPRVRYTARGPGYTLSLTGDQAVMTLTKTTPSVATGTGGTPGNPSNLAGSARPGSLGGPTGSATEKTTASVGLKLLGGNPNAKVDGGDRLDGVSNYLIGNDSSKWRTGVPGYGRVEYKAVYPGINLVYRGGTEGLEYDFNVAPGANPAAISWDVTGSNNLRIDTTGDLVMETAAGALRESRPHLYQDVSGQRREVPGRFVLRSPSQVGFDVGRYDQASPLIIDPVLAYSTYLGGSDVENVGGIAVDAAGSAYVTGQTSSANFPVTPGAFKTKCGTDAAGSCNNPSGGLAGGSDVFVTKLSPDGSRLVYSTYLGGGDLDRARSIAVDAAGAAYVTGDTRSQDFPTKNARQSTFGGGQTSAFVTKLLPTGADLGWSTFLNGSSGSFTSGVGIAIDGASNPYITGTTNHSDFPATSSAFDPGCGTDGACNANPTFTDGLSTGTMTFTSASANFTTNDVGRRIVGPTIPAGTTIATLVDATTVTLSATTVSGSGLTFSIVGPTFTDGTSSAGSTTFSSATANFAATDLNRPIRGGNIPVGTTIAIVTNPTTVTLSNPTMGTGTGITFTIARTRAENSPTTDAFVTKLSSDGTGLIYSTFLGSSRNDTGDGIAVDGSGTAYVTGRAGAGNFPTTPGAFQPTCGTGSCSAPFVTAIGPGGSSLRYSTFLTAPSGSTTTKAIAVDNAGSAYVTGFTTAATFPTKNAFQPAALGCTAASCPRTAFVTKLTSDGAALVYSSYLGGSTSQGGRLSAGVAIAVDVTGAAYVTGSTRSDDFPLVDPVAGRGGGVDAFVTKVAPSGSALIWSTYLGGSGQDEVLDLGGVALDAAGAAYVVGDTGSTDFPTASPVQATNLGRGSTDARDLFVAKIGPTEPGAPLITAVIPSGGPISGGTAVLLTGSHLTGTTAVTFGTAPASSFAVLSDTQITAVSPAQLSNPGTVPITVTTPQGTSPANPINRFTYGTGAWAATGSMVAARFGHTATRLLNGKVLVTGGNDATADHIPQNTAEVYDPATGTWSSAGTMATPRSSHSGTLLADGKVLIAGGLTPDSGPPADTFEVYDPTSNTWNQPTNTMVHGRFNFTATLLPSGKVLATGGDDNGANLAPTTAEVYDPATRTWTATGPLTASRIDHTATLLNTGKVLVVGGVRPSQEVGAAAVDATELYDPTSNTWSVGPPTNGGERIGATANLLVDGKVLLAGGNNGGSGTNTAQLYNPTANTWSPTGSLQQGRSGHAAVLLSNGTVLATGGRSGGTLDTAEVWNPTDGRWRSAGRMTVARSNGFTATVLSQGPVAACGSNCGKVLVVGGLNNSTAALSSAELYSPAPQVVTIDPAAGPGRGGSVVRVAGTGLASVTSVRFGTVAGTAVTPDPTSPDTALTVTAPAGAGAVDVTVTTTGGTSATLAADLFIYTGAPTATGISPSSGPTGGGTVVTVTGTNFVAGSTVKFGATPATNVTVVSPTSLTATAPTGTGAVNVTVTSPDGVSTAVPAAVFTYLGRPSVSGLAPSSGPASGGTGVTITGTGFTSGSTVSFGSTPATNVTVVSPTSLTATSPAGSGTANVTVTTVGGPSPVVPAAVFTFIAAPTVTGIAPSSGPAAGGTVVTITGTGFTSGSTVSFGSTPATNVTVTSPTSLTATSPAGSGSANVTVSTAGGVSPVVPGAVFTFVAPPSVSGVIPNVGPQGGGTTVTVTGSGFNPDSTVSFGAAAATGVTFVSSTSLTAVSPPGVGLVNVTVTTNGAVSPVVSGDVFTYANPIPTPSGKGYWLVASDGGIFAFGDAGFFGSTGATRLNRPIVGMAPTPTGRGYWLVASDGGIFAFGDARFFGSTGATPLNKPIVGMSTTPSGAGYWLVASDGGIFAFGDARFFGSTGATPLNKPIVGMSTTPSGAGYLLVASDGGIFAFGDAAFHGSTGGTPLNRPIVGMATTPSGGGYWLAASDGGIFAFGDAAFLGSTGGIPLNLPVVGMAASPTGRGYWLVASDGGIFSFGDAGFFGSTGGFPLAKPVVGMAVHAT